MTMWCVDDHPGCWRAWSNPSDSLVTYVVYSVEEWYAIDPDAAMAYDPALRAQHDFVKVCGLDTSAAVNASIVGALTR